jgi:hypothetical protein
MSGLDLTAAVDPAGHAAVAYFTQTATGVFEPVLARDDGTGHWTQEIIQIPVSQSNLSTVPELSGHYGIALAFDPQGNPTLAFLGGDNADTKPMGDGRWTNFTTGQPMPSSAVFMQKSGGNWNSQTVSTTSHDIVMTGFPVDDNGVVTGLWAGLVIDPTNVLHAFYRDIHFGSDQDATAVANLEYWQGNAAGTKAVGELVAGGRGDPIMLEGAGDYTRAVYASGHPAVVFALAPNDSASVQQIWFSQRTGNYTGATFPDGGMNDGAPNWDTVCVAGPVGCAFSGPANGEIGGGPSLAWQNGPGFAIGFYDSDEGVLKVFTSPDGKTWTPNTLEALGDTGHHAQVAFDGSGNLGVLYGFCHTPIEVGPTCSSSQQLRFRLGATGGAEVVAFVNPDAAAVVVDGSGKFMAIYKDPNGGVNFATRSP